MLLRRKLEEVEGTSNTYTDSYNWGKVNSGDMEKEDHDSNGF
jgi:hypothetical protein